MRGILISCLTAATAVFAFQAKSFAQQIGNWSNDTPDGWYDFTDAMNPPPIGGPLPPPIYTYANPATGMNDPGNDSLLFTYPGLRQGLAINLEDQPSGLAEFEANQAIQFSITVPASSTGYTAIYGVYLNTNVWGFQSLTANPVPASDFTPAGAPGGGFNIGVPMTTYIMTIPHTAALADQAAESVTPTYADFMVSTVNGDGASDQLYYNSAYLVTVPEPATGALGLVVLAGLLLRRSRGHAIAGH